MCFQRRRECNNEMPNEKKSISIEVKWLSCESKEIYICFKQHKTKNILWIGQLHLSRVLSYLALSSSHTPAPASPCLHCPSTPLPLPHIQQAHPRDHPLPLLSAVQSPLTELSLDGKRERKQLSAALSQPERNSPPTAAWLTGRYCLIPGWRDGSRERKSNVRTHQRLHTELSTDKRVLCFLSERAVSWDSRCS